jgi:hypothetical protein
MLCCNRWGSREKKTKNEKNKPLPAL